jgi:site-specific recombinase XerD
MIERYYKKPETWDRLRACWLFPLIERYIVWLTENNYAPRIVYRRVPILVHFADYARANGATSHETLSGHIDGFVEKWLRERAQHVWDDAARRSARNGVRGPLEQLVRLAEGNFQWQARQRKSFPFEKVVPGFEGYLISERGLAPAARRHHQGYLAQFESYLAGIRLSNLGDLTPPILTAFITERGSGYVRSSMTGLCSTLRVFLRYLYRERIHTKDLSVSVDGPKCYRLATLPRSISWPEVQRMFDCVDRRSASGKRDYAILLLLVTYGLRGHDVASLTLDDIDWERNRLRVPERKAGHSTAYPLSPTIGEALIDYLRHARPQSTHRQVFLRSLAPYEPCRNSTISQVAGACLRKAGITVRCAGSHTLRHSCVQRLVDAQFSLKAIGDYVGHASPESTVIYTKVNVEALREIALGHAEEVL